MILRIFRVETEPEATERFRDFFLNTALPMMKSTDGCVSVTAGLPRPETHTQFAMVMVWRDEAALEAFVGGDWRTPHIAPEEEGVVRARWLDHYTLVE